MPGQNAGLAGCPQGAESSTLGEIGRSIPQLSLPSKVSGQARYVGDIEVPNALHGGAVYSPHARARIVHIDVSRARQMPGVSVILTAADVARTSWGVVMPDQGVLANGLVRCAGEEVAVVAAETSDALWDALDAIDVEYEPLTPITDPQEALKPGSPLVHDSRPSNIAAEYRLTHGNVAEGFAQAEAVYEASYETAFVYPGFIEPKGCVVLPEPGGRLTIWGSTQSIFLAREMVALALGIPEAQIKVLQPTIGGSFGGKLMEDPNIVLTSLLALRAGRPVRWIYSRLEDYYAARPHLPEQIQLKMGITKSGLITAKECRIVADNGAYSGFAPECLRVSTMRADNLYRIPNLQTEALLVYTNNPPTGAYRGFGNPQMHFALESHIDMLAAKIGMDPLQVRLLNCVDSGDVTVHGWQLGSCGLRRCLEIVSKEIHSAGPPRRAETPSMSRGFGLACGIHVSGNRQGLGDLNWDGSSVVVRMGADGKPTLISGEGDIGQGANTVFAQIIAEELGLKLEDVTIAAPDTDTSPYCLGAYASRLTLIGGNAVRAATVECRRQIVALAGELLEADRDDLVLRDALVTVQGTHRSKTLAEICRAHQFRKGGSQISATGTYDAPTEASSRDSLYGNIAPGYSFVAEAAEVEVDRDTGFWRVVRMVVADDVGKALNPLICEGQIHGAVVQAIGMAASEQVMVEDGRIAGAEFADYHMPKAAGLPRIESTLVETNEPNGPYGAKGVSECSLVPVTAAIANALYDATGVRLTHLPFTPERLYAGLARNQ